MERRCTLLGDHVSLTDAAGRALLSVPSLACIALLLLNDHFLKAQSPSWITGKLSDVTGLFFVPYLALVLLALIRLRGTCALVIAYGVVGLLFVALKLSPVTNTWVLQLLATLGPVQATPDPTDVPALLMLPLSLGQLRRMAARSACAVGRSTDGIAPRTTALWLRRSVLAAAMLATVATSSAKPTISHIATDAIAPATAYVTLNYSQADGLYVTTDRGGSWTRVARITGSLTPDPSRGGIVYVVSGDSWDPSLDRVDVANAAAVSIKPASPGRRPQVLHIEGIDGVAIGAWPLRRLFFVRNGRALVSRDEGVTWTSLDVPGHVQAINTTRVANVMYVVAGVSLYSGSLYRSDDAGDSWRLVSQYPSNFARLAVDPDDPSLLFVAVGKSLMRSADAGGTWQEVHRDLGGASEQYARWLVEFDRVSGRIYLVFGFGCCALMSSTDQGLTWHEAGIEAAHVSVDVRGGVYVIGPSLTRVYIGDGAPPWSEVRARLPLEP